MRKTLFALRSSLFALGSWLLAFRFSLLAFRFWLFAYGSSLLAFSFWRLALGFSRFAFQRVILSVGSPAVGEPESKDLQFFPAVTPSEDSERSERDESNLLAAGL